MIIYYFIIVYYILILSMLTFRNSIESFFSGRSIFQVEIDTTGVFLSHFIDLYWQGYFSCGFVAFPISRMQFFNRVHENLITHNSITISFIYINKYALVWKQFLSHFLIWRQYFRGVTFYSTDQHNSFINLVCSSNYIFVNFWKNFFNQNINTSTL